ncbi:hypothetical protein NMY22_g10905 [Coprinellus aureogranulatus]|nr:hypothetical protein NMY22_g10905 [Coprinellus aureogranulatus]
MHSNTRHFLPLFLEDRSGLLTGSEFVDVHDRIKLSYRRTRHDQRGYQYCVFDTTSSRTDALTKPVVVLEFGTKGELGTVTFALARRTMRMDEYLQKASGNSRYRVFVGQDGRQYRWSYQTHEDHEWTCVDSSNQVVAFYNLKPPGEPQYAYSSGCMLTVEEQFGNLACELLATCMMMRHISAYNIT